MTKAQLIRAVAKSTGISVAKADKVVETFMKSVVEHCQGGDDVSLVGLGSFFSEASEQALPERILESFPNAAGNSKATFH